MKATFNYTKYLDKNPLQRFLIKSFFNNLIKAVSDLKVNRVLDAGCGEGILLGHFRRKHIGKYLEGVDSLKDAVVLAGKLYPKFVFKQGDIFDLPYEDDSFDLVACIEVLEHLENPKLAVREIRRVAKKYCLFSVPNEPIFRIVNFLRCRYVKDFGNTPGHINHWSKNSFVKFLEKEKIRIIKTRTSFPWTIALGEKI